MWILLILLLLPHSVKLPIAPSYVHNNSNTVGMYDIQTESISTGYMAFNLSIEIDLIGFNMSSGYSYCARSEKLVAIRYEFVERGIVEREVINVVMATSNATEPQVQNETFVEWTEQTTQIQHSFFVANLQFGDNTFVFDIEFEIDFLEEPEPALEEIRFGTSLHIDGPPGPLLGLAWFAIIVVVGVSVGVIVRAVALRLSWGLLDEEEPKTG